MRPIAAMRLRAAGGGAPAVPEAVSILALLKSWWSLDDDAASPTYADSHGANHLTLRTGGSTTNTSVISSATAKQGRSANFNRTDDCCAYIPRSNTDLDLPNADFSFGGWFRLGLTTDTTAFAMGRIGSGAATLQAYFGIEGSVDLLRAWASTDGTGSGRVFTSGIGSAVWSGAEYQLIVLTFNRTASQLELRFRRPGYSSGALVKEVVSFPSALYTGATSANFTICEGLSGDSTFFSANRSAAFYADECFFLDGAITDAEVDYLYNGGSGRTYAQLVADGT